MNTIPTQTIRELLAAAEKVDSTDHGIDKTYASIKFQSKADPTTIASLCRAELDRRGEECH